MNNTVTSNSRAIIFAALLLILLSIGALSVNYFIYQYPGLSYAPPNARAVAYTLLLMYIGVFLQFGKSSLQVRMLNEVVFFYVVIAIIALATNAIQFTPFPTIDHKIVTFETLLHINMGDMISWTHNQPLFKKLLEFAYTTLTYQIAYIPLIIIAARRWNQIREYYFLLLVSAIIGFSFYYFFPTTAPASVISSNYFSASQYATGLKFKELHQHIPPSTGEGGLISLPSFHIIWGWFCLYILRGWPVWFGIMLPVNILLIVSCVLLGWHYPIDILGSVLVIFTSHYLYYFYTARIKN